MKRAWWLLVVGAAMLVGSGCVGLAGAGPTTAVAPPPTARLAPSPTPTPTVVWFPPTATFTPLPPTPAPSPTPDLAAEAGPPLLASPLSSAAGWGALNPAAGRFGVAQGVLTLTVTAARGSLLVLRTDATAYNVYLTVEAAPQICRDDDAYGLVLRSTANASRYYRLGLTCRGQAFVEVVSGGVPVPRGEPRLAGVPSGAPVRARLSVRAQKRQLLFAVNGHTLFAIHDDLPRADHFGFFARAAGADGMSVGFQSLEIRSLPPSP